MNKIFYYLTIISFLVVNSCQQNTKQVLKKEVSQTMDPEKIMDALELDSDGKTEVVKKFPSSFPEVLTERGKPIVYTRENSNNFEYIGMPIGGIGAGQLYLGGDGQLWFWDIFGINYKPGHLKGEEAYEFPYERSRPNEAGARKLNQGFSVTAVVDGKKVTKKLNRDGFKNIEFLGQYPIGEVTYHDKDFPVKMKLEAFSPFAPLDLKNSMLPATVLTFTAINTSHKEIEADISGWIENAILIENRKNTKIKGTLVNRYKSISENTARLECAINNPNSIAKDQLDYGTMSLSIITDDKGTIKTLKKTSSVPISKKAELIGELSSTLKLFPGKRIKVSFVLTWHFPKTNAAIFHMGKKALKNPKWLVDNAKTRYYSEIYKDANAVSDYIIKNKEVFTANTRLWRDTWYDSSLPYWFLDRTFLNTSILASSTSTILNGGMFYGTEGGNQGVGTCNHVWGYVQSMGRLFPELEISLREHADFKPVSEGGGLKKDGGVRCRWYIGRMAVDGQAGTILRTYLTHQSLKDDAFLKRNYEGAKKVMNGLVDINDADHNGVLNGPQANTLDGEWFGEIAWLSIHYTAALRAMSIMAKEVGDTEYSKFCLETADKGKKYIEDNLFNGEYFFHKPDPNVPKHPGVYNGNEYSQLLGQSWAYQVGLGEIIDPIKTKTALESLWRYNFTTDVGPFRKVQEGGRWYAMPGEGGLIACTWPKGGKEVLKYGRKSFADYNNECQNGYEYAATSLMMWHDMPHHSLAHIWYMHNNRYIGSKRNPWCEIEWGIHYSRSMASYGHFTAVSGYEYHGPKGFLAFAPKITPWEFKSAFTGAEGWGAFEQTRKKDSQRNSIAIVYGKLNLKTLQLTVPENTSIDNLNIELNKEKLKFSFDQKKDKLIIVFDVKIEIKAKEKLVITMK